MGLLRTTAGADDTLKIGPVTRGEDGPPIDLTVSGTKVWFTARPNYGADPILEKTYGVVALDQSNGVTVNDPVTTEKNMLSVEVAEDTKDVTKTTNFLFDAWIQEPGGRDAQVYRGEWQVRPAVRASA